MFANGALVFAVIFITIAEVELSGTSKTNVSCGTSGDLPDEFVMIAPISEKPPAGAEASISGIGTTKLAQGSFTVTPPIENSGVTIGLPPKLLLTLKLTAFCGWPSAPSLPLVPLAPLVPLLPFLPAGPGVFQLSFCSPFLHLGFLAKTCALP